MNELALRLLIFYTQILVRDKTTVEWQVCVVVSVLFRDTNTNELRRNPIRQDVRTPMQHNFGMADGDHEWRVGHETVGIYCRGSARVANDAQGRVSMV